MRDPAAGTAGLEVGLPELKSERSQPACDASEQEIKTERVFRPRGAWARSSPPLLKKLGGIISTEMAKVSS